VPGVLYDLGRYPGLVRAVTRRRRVFGELYELPDDDASRVLQRLDKYEGREFARRRLLVTLRDGHRRAAWTYVLRARPPKSARLIDSGRHVGKRGAA